MHINASLKRVTMHNIEPYLHILPFHLDTNLKSHTR